MKRNEAKILGLDRYPPDEPCARCGTSERYTSGGACVSCMRSAARERAKPRKLLPFDQLPETREEAQRIGSKYFRPKVPCKHGHLSRRLTRSGVCMMCQRRSVNLARVGIATDSARRASGLVKLEVWVYPKDLDAVRNYVDRLVASRPVVPPILPPVPTPRVDSDIDLR